MKLNTVLLSMSLLSALNIAAFSASGCELRAVDTFNKQSYALAIKPVSKSGFSFELTEGIGTSYESKSLFGFDSNGILTHQGGMPNPPKSEILNAGREANDALSKKEFFEDGQMVWTPVRGEKCSDIETGLIRFYNEEFILH